MSSPDRRRFLSLALGGTAVGLTTPSLLEAATTPWQAEGGRGGRPLLAAAEILPEGRGLSGPPGQEEERYWERVKEEFTLAPGLILMNAANLCPSPYRVQEDVFRHTRDVNQDASFQNRGKFGTLKEEARGALADYVGASPSEIAITRNTSEGNNTVVNGLDLGPGDEVLIWDQNHPTNNISWDVRARRWGFTVRRVATPPGPSDRGQLLEAFSAAISPATRVLGFSHVSNVSGVALPARELCQLARERGILTLVDGAQSFGALALNLRSMGCDFFTASSHKWFMGPKEAGLLFVRQESQERLWPSDVGVGWEGAEGNGAQKFENLGQRDDAAVVSMATAAAFHQAIGKEAVEARVRALVASTRARLSEAMPGASFHTPAAPDLSAGVLVFSIPGATHGDVFQGVYENHRLGCASMGGAFEGIRLSPHIYNTLEDVRSAVEALSTYG